MNTANKLNQELNFSSNRLKLPIKAVISSTESVKLTYNLVCAYRRSNRDNDFLMMIFSAAIRRLISEGACVLTPWP